jgi:hypothetical protein
MPILFTISWDIIPGNEQEYSEFIAKTFMPEATAMGLTPVGGFYVEVGNGPRVIGVNSCDNHQTLAGIVTSQRFKDLILNLKKMVYNYKTAVLEPTGAVKNQTYEIQKGVWKFNQYYDLRPGVKEAYKDYILNVHLPTMAKIDYVEVTGGWNVVLGGVSEIIAEFTVKDPIDIGRLLNNDDFRKITLKLRTDYVWNYQSRVLRCTERFEEPKWFRL